MYYTITEKIDIDKRVFKNINCKLEASSNTTYSTYKIQHVLKNT